MKDLKWEEYTAKFSQEKLDRWVRIHVKMKEDFLRSMIRQHCSWHQKFRIWLNVKLGWKFIKIDFIESVYLMGVDPAIPALPSHSAYGVKINGKTYWM